MMKSGSWSPYHSLPSRHSKREPSITPTFPLKTDSAVETNCSRTSSADSERRLFTDCFAPEGRILDVALEKHVVRVRQSRQIQQMYRPMTQAAIRHHCRRQRHDHQFAS